MRQERVLIVEDEENERSGLAEIVSSWGYRVETARDGAEGLEKATQWSPSIVITDLKMPRMGGIELLGHLGEQVQTIAVVLVTAQGTIESAVQAMRMGAYDYLTKPIDTNRLRTMLTNASALLGTRAELEARKWPSSTGRWLRERRGKATPAGRLAPLRQVLAKDCAASKFQWTNTSQN